MHRPCNQLRLELWLVLVGTVSLPHEKQAQTCVSTAELVALPL